MSTAKLKKDVLKILEEQPLSLKELAVKMGLKEKKVFNLLKGLFSSGEIASVKAEDGNRKYRVVTSEERALVIDSKEEDIDDDDEEDDDEDK